MSTDITKEELNAFTVSHEKVATSLEKIAGQLEQITDRQNEINEKLSNGVTETIISGVVDNYNATHKETVNSLIRIEENQKEIKEILSESMPTKLQEKIDNSSLARDMDHLKFLISAVGVIVIIVEVILRILGNNFNSSQDQAMKHLLEDHIQQTQGRSVSTVETQ